MGFDYAINKQQIVFFIIETSAAMEGTKISIINEAMCELLIDLKKRSDNEGVITKVAIMQCANGAEWLTPIPVDVDNFSWNDLETCCGANLGEACKLLDSKLHIGEFFQSKVVNLAPIIILISDGNPTDDFTSELAKLKENSWFRHSIKLAISFGEDTNKDILKDFTGSYELVITSNKLDELKQWILRCIKSIPSIKKPPKNEVCKNFKENRLAQSLSTQHEINEYIKNIEQIDLTSEDDWI